RYSKNEFKDSKKDITLYDMFPSFLSSKSITSQESFESVVKTIIDLDKKFNSSKHINPLSYDQFHTLLTIESLRKTTFGIINSIGYLAKPGFNQKNMTFLFDELTKYVIGTKYTLSDRSAKRFKDL